MTLLASTSQLVGAIRLPMAWLTALETGHLLGRILVRGLLCSRDLQDLPLVRSLGLHKCLEYLQR